MGTTKDPEGFRRHSSGRRQVLGTKAGEDAPRRGCGLGAALVVAGLGLGAALVWSNLERDTRALDARAAPAPAPSVRAHEAVADVAAPASPQRDTAPATIDAPAALRSVLDAPASAARPDAAPRTRASRPIRLLRGWSDLPLADAEVYWIGRGDLVRMREQGLTVTTVEFAPVLQSHGRHERSDSEGRLLVTADGCHLLVVTDDWTREVEIELEREGPTDVRIFAPRTLTVDVVDWRARPAHGMLVEFWRVEAGGRPVRRMYATRTSHASGVMRLEDVDAVLYPVLTNDPPRRTDREGIAQAPDAPALEPTRVRVALDAELAPAAWAEIDLALDPLPQVRLQLPPLGELRVLVHDAAGEPVAWRGYVELRYAGDSAPASTRALVGGRAEFANLRFGRELRATAVRAEVAKVARGEARTLPPLSPDEPEREVVLPDVPGSPRLLVRPLDPEGLALPGAWVSVNVQSRRALREDERQRLRQQFEGRIEGSFEGRIERGAEGRLSSLGGRQPLGSPAEREIPTHTSDSWTRVLRCDARGYLEVPLPDALLDADEGRLVVSLVRDEATLSSEAIALERGDTWRDIDLGPVLLRQP